MQMCLGSSQTNFLEGRAVQPLNPGSPPVRQILLNEVCSALWRWRRCSFYIKCQTDYNLFCIPHLVSCKRRKRNWAREGHGTSSRLYLKWTIRQAHGANCVVRRSFQESQQNPSEPKHQRERERERERERDCTAPLYPPQRHTASVFWNMKKELRARHHVVVFYIIRTLCMYIKIKINWTTAHHQQTNGLSKGKRKSVRVPIL